MFEKLEAALNASRDFIALGKRLGTDPAVIDAMQRAHDATAELHKDIVAEVTAIREVVGLVENAMPRRVDGSLAHRPAVEA